MREMQVQVRIQGLSTALRFGRDDGRFGDANIPDVLKGGMMCVK